MAFLLNQNATSTCTHGGSALPIAGNARVKINGVPVLTTDSQFAVAACPNVVGTSPYPCALGAFVTSASRVKVNGAPVLLETSQAINTPTGATLTLVNPQRRVKGM